MLDACCGPQLGTVSLINYSETVIDTTTSLYLQYPTPGGVADITDGPGVEALVMSRCFSIPKGTPSLDVKTLFDLVAASLWYKGTWEERQMIVPAGVRSVTARRYLETSPGHDEIFPTSNLTTIYVSRYTNIFELTQDSTLREASLSAWSPSAVGGLKCSK